MEEVLDEKNEEIAAYEESKISSKCDAEWETNRKEYEHKIQQLEEALKAKTSQLIKYIKGSQR